MKKQILTIVILGIVVIIFSFVFFARYQGWFQKKYMQFKTKSLVFHSKKIEGNLNYRFFSPNHKSTESLPLVLVLHGAGGRGNNNIDQLTPLVYHFINKETQDSNPCYVVVPQCPTGVEWVNRSNNQVPYTHYSQDDTKESSEMKLIIELLNETKKEFPIDSSRIYIVGFSMGATGTWDILSRYPDFFAGAAIFSGVSDTTKARLLSHIPILAFSGEDDNIAPARLNEEMCTEINSFNGKCKFIKLKNVGHDCVSVAFETTDVIKELFEHKRI